MVLVNDTPNTVIVITGNNIISVGSYDRGILDNQISLEKSTKENLNNIIATLKRLECFCN